MQCTNIKYYPSNQLQQGMLLNNLFCLQLAATWLPNQQQTLKLHTSIL